MLASGDANPSAQKRGPKAKILDDKVGQQAASLAAQMDTTMGQAAVGGLLRPWMTYGTKLQARTVVEDLGVILWEGGAKTTQEIKRDLIDLLDQADSLVAVVDLKAAEHPEDGHWWPSLRVVQAWLDEDPFFAKAIDHWNHARQARILESVIWDLNNPKAGMTKAEFMLLKERVKFASAVLPRIVNKGMREKVDVETTNNHLHLYANLSDEALQDKLSQLRRDPRVRELLSTAEPRRDTITGEMVSTLPPAGLPEVEPLPFKDPDALGGAL
jgi:hypothetical protein